MSKYEAEFDLHEASFQAVANAIKEYQDLKTQIEELQQESKRKGRTELTDKLLILGDQNDKAYVDAECFIKREATMGNDLSKTKMEDVAKNQREMQRQLQDIKRELNQQKLKNSRLQREFGTIKEEMGEMKKKVNEMDQKIFAVDRILDKIQKIDNPQEQEYFNIFYRLMINHFMAYRISSTGFFTEEHQAFGLGDRGLDNLCKAQSIVEKIPVIGDLVAIPFQIIDTYRGEKTGHLNAVIAQKIRDSRFADQAKITEYMAYAIDRLLSNIQFRKLLLKQIMSQNKSYLNKISQKITNVKNFVSAKIFGSTQMTFSYVQELLVLHMTQITIMLFKIQPQAFIAASKSKDKFYALIKDAIYPEIQESNVTNMENSDLRLVIQSAEKKESRSDQMYWCLCLPTTLCLTSYCICSGCSGCSGGCSSCSCCQEGCSGCSGGCSSCSCCQEGCSGCSGGCSSCSCCQEGCSGCSGGCSSCSCCQEGCSGCSGGCSSCSCCQEGCCSTPFCESECCQKGLCNWIGQLSCCKERKQCCMTPCCIDGCPNCCACLGCCCTSEGCIDCQHYTSSFSCVCCLKE